MTLLQLKSRSIVVATNRLRSSDRSIEYVLSASSLDFKVQVIRFLVEILSRINFKVNY